MASVALNPVRGYGMYTCFYMDKARKFGIYPCIFNSMFESSR